MADRQKESYPFYIWSGLLRDGHYQKMGIAIWTFMWCIDKTTKENPDGQGNWSGKVLGGRPITAEEIAENLKISTRTIKQHINILRKEKYIKTRRTPHGIIIEVAKSKKHLKSEVKKPSLLNQSEVKKPSLLNQSEVKKPSPRSEETFTSNKTKQGLNSKSKYIYSASFEKIWSKYPKPVGKKEAFRHFEASIKTEEDLNLINQALENYLIYIKRERIEECYIQNGSKWFNNWQDWIDYKGPKRREEPIPPWR